MWYALLRGVSPTRFHRDIRVNQVVPPTRVELVFSAYETDVLDHYTKEAFGRANEPFTHTLELGTHRPTPRAI